MNQADVSKLVSKLRIRINPRHKNLKNPAGPEGRLHKLRQTVNALFKYERLELNYTLADETRGYAERVSDWRLVGFSLGSNERRNCHVNVFAVNIRSHKAWRHSPTDNGNGWLLDRRKTTDPQAVQSASSPVQWLQDVLHDVISSAQGVSRHSLSTFSARTQRFVCWWQALKLLFSVFCDRSFYYLFIN